jgi:hypothetical protein
MVNRLTITSPKSYDHVCKGCVLGKSHCLPFPNASHTHYEKMELIVVDLSGLMSVWTGKAYAFVVVEINSRLGTPGNQNWSCQNPKDSSREIRMTIWKEIKAVTHWCWEWMAQQGSGRLLQAKWHPTWNDCPLHTWTEWCHRTCHSNLLRNG